MFHSFVRVLKFSIQNIIRNFWLSFVTCSIIMLTLSSSLGIYFLNVISKEIISEIQEKIDITLYFKPQFTQDEVKAVQSKLKTIPKIKVVKFISRKEALETFKKKHQNDPNIQESLKELQTNPLGDLLIIKAKDPNDYPSIIQGIKFSNVNKMIEDLEYASHKDFIEKINKIVKKINTLGITLVIIFSLISLLVVFNTIRMSIFTYSEEISIMKLVGASNWFIQAPFLIDSIIFAFISTFSILILFYPIIIVIEPFFKKFLEGNFSLLSYYTTHIFSIFFISFIIIAIINIIATFIATKKYLEI